MNTVFSSASIRRIVLSLAPIALFACIVAPVAQAQSVFGARRANDLSTFISTSAVTPDYFPGRAMGITAGADWTTHHNRFATSFEVRGNRTANDMLIERSITFGPRIQTLVRRRYHPYADFLIGGGTIVFLNGSANYHEDRGMVTSMGGGLDIDVTPHFGARVDFQNQGWNIGKIATTSDVTFSPNLLSIGVQYHIPFRPRMSRNF